MMQEQIKSIFEKFNQLNVLVIGDVMIDAYLWGKVERISPEAPVPIVALKHRESRLGGAANVALNVQSLGATPYLVSAIGEGARADEFLQLMDEQGLPKDGIVKCQDRLTTTKFRIIGNNAQMLRVDEEIEDVLEQEHQERLLQVIKNLIAQKKADVIIFEDYDKGVISQSLIREVVSLAQSKHIPVTVDPKKRNFMNYQGVTLFKPNLKELKEGLKLDLKLDQPEEICQVLRDFQYRQNIDIVLATLSERGILISRKKGNHELESFSCPAHIRNISDVSGAGDTVISVASLCLALGLSDELIARLSNLAGGLVCEYVGVVPVPKEKLLSEAIRLIHKG